MLRGKGIRCVVRGWPGKGVGWCGEVLAMRGVEQQPLHQGQAGSGGVIGDDLVVVEAMKALLS